MTSGRGTTFSLALTAQARYVHRNTCERDFLSLHQD